MSYSKLHSSIVNSSLWTERDSVRILFITLLAMCDRDGIVYGSKAGLSRIAHIKQTDEAWTSLLSPDPDSCDRMRAPEHEGRRIEEVPGGFRLLNFEYYRGLRNEDDRREQNRVAQARFKAKKNGKPDSAKVSQGKPRKAHTEAEADTNTEAEAEAEAVARSGAPTPEKADEWLSKIKAMDCYKALKIDSELGKAHAWCMTRRRKCTERFFLNWLNRALDDYRTVAPSAGIRENIKPKIIHSDDL